MSGLHYESPATLEQALELLGRWDGEARALAGGMSLLPAMNLGTVEPTLLVSLAKVDGLKGIEVVARELRIGAGVTQDLMARHPLVRRHAPSLARAAGGLADVQVRNRGTLGGSLAFAHPGAEAATVLTAHSAAVTARSPRGERRLSIQDLVTGAFENSLAPDELITHVSVPFAPDGSRTDYLRFSRIQGNYSTVNIAVLLHEAGVRAGIGGATPAPLLVESPIAVTGPDDEEALAELSARASAACVHAYTDHMASADYRRAMAGVLARRTARTAFDHPPMANEGV